MNVLAIDSSGLAASAALVSDDKVLGEFFLNCKMTHSVTLMPMVENMLEMIDFDKDNIDVLAITSGPGSFTGLRIGMACIKGLAKALGKPVAPVPTLDVVAFNGILSDKLIVPVMDARRDRVYYSIYTSDGKSLERLCDYGCEPIEEVVGQVRKISGEAVFFGDGAEVYRKEIENAGFEISPISSRLQRASGAGLMAMEMAKEGRLVSGSEAELIYLRKPQAEREREERLESLKFREMTRDDIEAMAAIEKKCFTTPWSAKMIEDDYNNGLTYYVICELDGEIIGYGGMWHVINEGHITNIAIIPGRQGRGFGGRLMEEMIKLAEDKEMIELTLEVRESNERAIRLYEKYGFKKEGVRRKYYEDTHEDALIMWKKL